VNRARDKRFAVVIAGGDSRVLKFAHMAREIFELNSAQIAALCVLLLRGPQTAGEIRGRTAVSVRDAGTVPRLMSVGAWEG
jgi:uncharacterized protein YceH (UPF0502 family)